MLCLLSHFLYSVKVMGFSLVSPRLWWFLPGNDRREEGLGAGYVGSDPFGSSGSLGQLSFCEMELHIVAWGSKNSVLYLRELLVLGSPALSCIQAGIGAGINRR